VEVDQGLDLAFVKMELREMLDVKDHQLKKPSACLDSVQHGQHGAPGACVV